MARQRKDGRGRKTVMTAKVLDKLEEAFAWGCSDVEACLWADIAPATLYKYQVNNPDYAERKAELKETPVLLARQSVVRRLPRDSRLSMDYLSRKRRDEFSTKTENDVRVKELPKPILGGLAQESGDAIPSDHSD